MKKSLFYFFAMLLALNFSSCGKDEGGMPPPSPEQEIAGTYVSDKLNLTFNGQDISGRSVTLEAVSADKVTATLKGAIPGADEVKIDLVMAQSTKSEAVVADYRLEGSATIEGSRTVSAKGNVKGDVLTLSLDIKVDSPLVGKWGLAPYVESDINGDGIINDNDYNVMGGGFFLSLATADGNITFGGETKADYEFCKDTDQKAEGFLNASLQEISFLENGNIVATYNKDGKTTTSPEGLAGYYVKDKMVYITLDLTKIIDMLQSKSIAHDPFEGLVALAKNGIPLAFKIENGICSIFVDNALATSMNSNLTLLLPMLPTLMPDKKEMIGEIEKLLPQIMADKDFMVGINLMKK
ncbi:DUF4925 domain-containing protein [Parabacteroides sp. AF18-52]|jgi:hypothetical protein|uniref:DUF4925 domain-containing protein n=1 Tax=Parabacteroides TaxID=375288 RepID=UPI000EFE5A35|nr:DUF4925 domain-containing protein [Parabacteroides sp. AF18-52]RHR43182.1 DUF4925 domain-containing protein [Parabacteroides sp. AF18-52]